MYVRPRFRELMRQQPLQNTHVPSVFPILEDVERRFNMINNNDVNYHNPPVFNFNVAHQVQHQGVDQQPNDVSYYNPLVFNFNVAHQVQQQGVNQQPNDVASTSRGKSPRVRWTDELHAMFVKAVQDWGGTWATKPRHIMMEMKGTGVSLHQIKTHLQKYRASQVLNVVGGRKPISEASFKKKQKKLLQQVEEQMLKVDGKKSIATQASRGDDDMYIPQLPTKAETENMATHEAALGTSLEDFLNYLPN